MLYNTSDSDPGPGPRPLAGDPGLSPWTRWLNLASLIKAARAWRLPDSDSDQEPKYISLFSQLYTSIRYVSQLLVLQGLSVLYNMMTVWYIACYITPLLFNSRHISRQLRGIFWDSDQTVDPIMSWLQLQSSHRPIIWTFIPPASMLPTGQAWIFWSTTVGSKSGGVELAGSNLQVSTLQLCSYIFWHSSLWGVRWQWIGWQNQCA